MARLALALILVLISLLLVYVPDIWLPFVSTWLDRPLQWGWFAVWAAVTFLAVQGLIVAFWPWLERRSGHAAPQLLTTMSNAIIWLVSLSVATVQLFDFSPTGLLTTSSVIIAIVGLALRNMIADLFYGITMAIERPFDPGDWIATSDGVIGEVTDFTWRATQIVTLEELKVVLPNSLLATTRFVNYSRPTPVWRKQFEMPFPYETSSFEIERLLESAVMQVPETEALHRPSQARIKSFENWGVVWDLRFWVPDFKTSERVGYEVMRTMLRNMHFAGISVPREKQEMFVRNLERQWQDEEDRRKNWVSRVELFESLNSVERYRLQEMAEPKLFVINTDIVRQGEEGASLFVLHEGFLDVLVTDEKGVERKVATLRPGDFFGEMSLLTGAHRGATVRTDVDSTVFEVTKEDIAPALQAHPELVESMSRIVAERQQANSRTLEDGDKASAEEQARVNNMAGKIADSIRGFFHL